LSFIYTRCAAPKACPYATNVFGQLQLVSANDKALAKNMRLVSLSFDPEHDTPEVLARYAARYGAGDRWWFLTGDKGDIYCLAEQGFHLGVVNPAAPAPPSCGRALGFGPHGRGRATAPGVS